METKYLDNTPIYPAKHNKSMWVWVIGILLVITTFAHVAGIGFVSVDGESMQPNLQNGEMLLGYKPNPNDIKRGDVIIFDAKEVDPRDTSSTYYIKRVIGMPGDTISFNGKNIYVNGRKYLTKGISSKAEASGAAQTLTDYKNETYNKWDLKSLSMRHYNNSGNSFYWNMSSINTGVVPDGCYFVMGDNRAVSNDSREFGYVPFNDISYKVYQQNLF